MTFAVGDTVHVKAIGKGIVREVRNRGRYLVDVKGQSIVTTADQLTASEASPAKKPAPAARVTRDEYSAASEQSLSIDLHGQTADEAMNSVAAFIDRALRAHVAEVRIIHGRSGGRVKAAVHAQLRAIPTVRGFTVDPGNAGVTIVKL